METTPVSSASVPAVSLSMSTWYYLEESGPGIGALHTGWHKEPETEKWYYLRASGRDLGRMETGWFLDVNDGHWYWLDPADGGAMAPERTLVGGPELCWPREVEGTWEKRPDGSWSFRLEEGTDFTLTGSAMENGMGPGTGTMGGAVGSMTPDGLASGWQYIPYEKDGVKGRAWYHFDRTGRMTTGWYQGLNTCWYYLAESGPDIGRLVTGWFTDPATGKRHYLREDPPDTGRMAVGWYYHLTRLSELRLVFDPDFSRRSISDNRKMRVFTQTASRGFDFRPVRVAATLVKAFDVIADGKTVFSAEDNFHSLVRIPLDIRCSRLEIRLRATNGAPRAHVFSADVR